MNPSEFGLLAQLACARREVNLRRIVYSKRIAAHTMSEAEAEREIACMGAIVLTLEKLRLEEENRDLLPGLKTNL